MCSQNDLEENLCAFTKTARKTMYTLDTTNQDDVLRLLTFPN